MAATPLSPQKQSRILDVGRAGRGSRHLALVMIPIVIAIVLGSLLSALPTLAAPPAMAQIQTGAEARALQAAPGAGSIEVHLAECPPGFDLAAGGNYFDDCHALAAENVEITLTSTAGFSDTRTSARVEESGPGVGIFEGLAAGDYTIAVDWPVVPTDTYFSYCSEADSDLELTVTPNDASTGQVTLGEGQQIVCDVYLAHDPRFASPIELSAFTCPAGAVPPSDSPAFTDFQTACTTPVPALDFHLLDATTDADTVETTDDNGRVTFAFDGAAGADFYADVPLEANEWMFCSTNEAEPAFLIFDEEGVTAFEPGEQRSLICSWFLIEDEITAAGGSTPDSTPAQATDPAADTPLVTPPPATELAPAGETDVPAAPDARIAVAVLSCAQGYDVAAEGDTYEAFDASCNEPLAEVGFNLTAPDGGVETQVTSNQSAIGYDGLPPGTYTLHSDIPLEAASEHLFCAAPEGGARYQKEFDERGVTTFADLDGEQLTCAWFVVPTSQRGEETGGSVQVNLAACPVGYTGGQFFDDCHGNGIADQQFRLSGPAGEQTGTTTVAQTPGPGTVIFTSLGAGDYTLQGGPPGDFGTVELACAVQPTGQPVDVTVESTAATLTIAENQDLVCDWYFIGEDASGGSTPTATPTPEPARAEILVTLYSCPPAADNAGTYSGATREAYASACAETVDDVPFSLGNAGAVPLQASTGASGDGAVRFYDLLPADFRLAPSLPDELSSAAVFCTIGEGETYQKALQNGATAFVAVNGDGIACDWYVVEARRTLPAGASGSITVREYLCTGDRTEGMDWETECAPGASGSRFTITPSGGTTGVDGTPDARGVHVFAALADGFYELEQNDGTWCRAVADRVDSRSRVIVQNGGNTDVVLYQCSAVARLPATGTGPGGTVTAREESGFEPMEMVSLALLVVAVPILILAIGRSRQRRRIARVEPVENVLGPIVTAAGKTWMRFK